MKFYEVVEDLGDGSSAIRRFKTSQEADTYCKENGEWFYNGYHGYREVDTESENFFYRRQ